MKGAATAAGEASAQLKRLLALVPVIADGEDHSIEEIAAMLDVDAKTVVRDLTSVGERYDTPGGVRRRAGSLHPANQRRRQNGPLPAPDATDDRGAARVGPGASDAARRARTAGMAGDRWGARANS